MDSPVLDVVRLQVNVAEPRNLLRNPSGVEGPQGWFTQFGMTILTGQNGVESEDGACFQAPQSASTPAMTGHLVPVTGGYWLGATATTRALAAGTRDLSLSVIWFDAQGLSVGTDLVASARTGTQSNAFIGAVQAPAAAVYALPTFQVQSGITRPAMNLGRIMLRVAPTSAATNGAYVPADWRSITGKTFSIDCDHGAELDGVEDTLVIGRLSAVVGDATIDPAVSTFLRRGRPVRVQGLVVATWKDVWNGNIENGTAKYKNRDLPQVTITATDIGTALATTPMTTVPQTGFAGQSARIAAAAGQSVFDGTRISMVSGVTIVAARDDSAKATDWLRRACNTFGAGVWVDAGGWLQSRLLSYFDTTPVATLTDQDPGGSPSTISYTDVDLNYGSRALVNALDVVRVNVDEVEDNGAKTYGPYVASESERINGRVPGKVEITTGSPAAIAAVILPVFATPRVFPETVTVNPRYNMAATIGVIGPYSPVRVVKGAYSEVVRVLKVDHNITHRGWLVTYTPRPLETATPTPVTTPSAGADTGPGDLITPEPGILGERNRSTNFNINHITPTTIPFDTAIVADGITWDASNSRWVAPRDGRYHVTGTVHFNTNATGYRNAMIYVNGTERNRAQLPAVSANGGAGVHVSKTVKLVAGDVVSIVATQSCGVALAVIGNANQNTTASIAFIGP